ncbi:GNAT family N-acetyltransferase [Virgibacillus halophilus]|uniref:GNAT family N-acetyltransferase n=1 Tax=Tigheibacillus halophilus TaxID=361280 RepID=UPI00363A4AB8
MLKKRDLHEVPVLFELMSHTDVFPFVRHKAYNTDEYYFLTKQTIEAEEQGELISRTILDEFQQPIGTINLFDIENDCGFLATWLGQPYFGKGYNRLAKDAFFAELFYQHNIKTIFMKVRKDNIRSRKAVLKLSFTALGNDMYPDVYNKLNQGGQQQYDLFAITKEHYASYLAFANVSEVSEDAM